MNRLSIVAALATASLVPVRAEAQSRQGSKLEVAAGYSGFRNLRVDPAYRGGMFISVEGHNGGWLGLVGEFDGNFDRRPARYLGDLEAGTGGFFAGPKFTVRRIPRLDAFGQVLVGEAASGDGTSASYPAVGVQPGGGVDIRVRQHIALRLAADLRLLAGLRAASGATASVAIVRAGFVVH